MRLPLIPKHVALQIFSSMRNGDLNYWDGTQPIAQLHHVLQRSIGSATDDYKMHELRDLRMQVLGDLEDLFDASVEQRSLTSIGEFDRRLARSLSENLKLTPIESSYEGCWSFLALLVLPEIPWIRYGKKFSESRFIGGERNVFRVAWERQRVLGSILYEGIKPLQEDELVGLFERSKMARNEHLVRRTAIHILQTDVMNRSKYVRRLNVEIGKETGTVLLDDLGNEEMDSIINSAGMRARAAM